MKEKALTFNKTGYDPFIDFLKTYSIICVIIAHLLPTEFYKYILFQLWGGMQVPMFVLIQVFHAYKKNVKPKLNRESLVKRIILPFVFIQITIFIFRAIAQSKVVRDLLISTLIGGGYGPGSYYIWIYLQIAFLLVIIWPLVKKLSLKQLLIAFLIISILLEVFFSVFHIPDWLYRLLCIRYLFLIPLGMMWVQKGVVLNNKTVLLSILSIVAVLFLVFTNYDLEPFLFNTGWKTHRWICYFYLPLIFTYGLYRVWNIIKKVSVVDEAIKWAATRSYEIFLAQMAIIACLKTILPSFVSNGFMPYPILAILVFVCSFILGGFIFLVSKTNS